MLRFSVAWFFMSVLFFTTFVAKAQNRSNISIASEIGLPSGNFANLSNIGLGASLKLDIPVAEKLAITVNGGFMNFFGRHNQLFNVADLTYIPLKGGVKYFFSEGFYAEGQFGTAFPLNDGQKTVIAWSPGFGNFFKLRNNNRLDLGIRYEGWSGKNDAALASLRTNNTRGFAALRFGYLFGL